MTTDPDTRLHVFATHLADGSDYDEVWLERVLDARWVAAYRLLPHQGVPTAVELRIFPSAGERDPGRWRVEQAGNKVEFPPAGIMASCVRSAKTGVARYLTPDHRRVLLDVWGAEAIPPEAGVAIGPGIITGDAMTRVMSRAVRRGPKGKGDLFWASVARSYHRAIENGERQPNRFVALELEVSSKYAAELVAKARKQGLLTPASGPGRADGAMTEKAQRILAGAAAVAE